MTIHTRKFQEKFEKCMMQAHKSLPISSEMYKRCAVEVSGLCCGDREIFNHIFVVLTDGKEPDSAYFLIAAMYIFLQEYTEMKPVIEMILKETSYELYQRYQQYGVILDPSVAHNSLLE